MRFIYRRILGKVGVGLLCIVLLSLSCNPLGNTTSSTAEEYNDRGVDYWEQGQLELAIEQFDQAIAIDPQYADAYYNRGNA